jgi:hypothetical protein
MKKEATMPFFKGPGKSPMPVKQSEISSWDDQIRAACEINQILIATWNEMKNAVNKHINKIGMENYKIMEESENGLSLNVFGIKFLMDFEINIKSATIKYIKLHRNIETINLEGNLIAEIVIKAKSPNQEVAIEFSPFSHTKVKDLGIIHAWIILNKAEEPV